MAILADQHLHTSYSFDSKADMTEMIEKAISLGLKQINFTDHNDFDFPVSADFPEGCWDLNVDSYLYTLLNARAKYEGKIEIGFGMELGLQESCFRKNAVLARSHEFDFIIGSIHLVNNTDTYDPALYVGKSARESFDEYFDTLIRNINRFENFDVLGHLDCLTLNIPGGEAVYNPNDYMDKIDEIFNFLIEREKGIEINTKAILKGLKNPNPCPLLVKRYKELGGEIITVGSDAHKPEDMAANFDVAESILKDCGFKYYSVFKDRLPNYVKLI